LIACYVSAVLETLIFAGRQEYDIRPDSQHLPLTNGRYRSWHTETPPHFTARTFSRGRCRPVSSRARRETRLGPVRLAVNSRAAPSIRWRKEGSLCSGNSWAGKTARGHGRCDKPTLPFETSKAAVETVKRRQSGGARHVLHAPSSKRKESVRGLRHRGGIKSRCRPSIPYCRPRAFRKWNTVFQRLVRSPGSERTNSLVVRFLSASHPQPPDRESGAPVQYHASRFPAFSTWL